MLIEKVKITELKVNEKNPRIIKDEKFKKLVKSIKDFPEMLSIRPIVVDEQMMVLGGNMRYKACLDSGLKEVYILKVSNLTEDQKNEFIIKDNSSFGEWDWNLLKDNWDLQVFTDWAGMDHIQWGNDDKLNTVNKGNENDEWIGMPEFNMPEKNYRLLINFENKDDMEEFCKIKKIDPHSKKESAWTYRWPENNRKTDDLNSLKIN